MQRAVGELRVGLRVRDGRTVLDGLRQAGCLKARFPRPQDVDWAERRDAEHVRRHCRRRSAGQCVRVASRGARDDRGAGGGAVLSRFAGQRAVARQDADRGRRRGAAEWLPQETILFDRCAMDRRLEVELAEDAWFLGVETLVFGRAAMGETVEHAWLRDVIRVRRGGRLVVA